MRRLAWVLAVVWFGAIVAQPDARADEPSVADTQAAKIHFQAGEQYYLRGHYSEAIGEFKEAYRLSQAAALLYNISQAYERMGDLPHAREYMQKYLDSGQADPGEVPALKEKLRILDKRIADQKAADDARRKPPEPAPAPSPTPTTTTQAPPIAPAPIETEGPRPWKTWKWVAVGTGAGCLVLAGLFAADGAKMAKDLEDAAKTQTPYVNDLPDKYARGQRDNVLTAVFGIGGVALAATGVVLFVLDGKSASEKPPQARVVPIIGPGSAGAMAAWTF